MSRIRFLSAAVVACLALSAVPFTASAAPPKPGRIDASSKTPQTFRYLHKAGQINRYDTKVAQEVSMKGDQPNPAMAAGGVTTSMSATINMKTEKVLPTGDATILTTYETFDMSLNQGGQTIGAEQLGPLVDMVKKIRASATVSPLGEQKDISFAGLPNEMRQLQDSFRNALIGASPAFPTKGIKPGESWTQKVPMDLRQGPIQLKMEFQIKYTFMGYGTVDKVKVAVFKTGLDLVIDKVPSKMMGVDVTLDGGGKGAGFIYFDPTLGRLVKSDMELNQDINMTINAPEGAQSIKMNLTTSASMKLKP